jgi:hypothetical protein
MAYDIERLQAVMDFIDAHPEQHDQRLWINRRNTVACFAGWTCLLAGAKKSFWSADCRTVKYQGQTVHVLDLAAKLLGLSSKPDMLMLFDTKRTRYDLRTYVNFLITKELERRVELEAVQ